MRFIKLFENIQNWHWFHDGNMLKLWIYLLVNANWVDGQYGEIYLNRGQLKTTVKDITKATDLTIQQVRTGLKRLSKQQQTDNKRSAEISVKSTSGFSIITILNYDTYQDNKNSEQQTDNKRITNGFPKKAKN
jgi:hypothetical protein